MLRKIFSLVTVVSLALFLNACQYKLAGTAQPLPFRTIALKQVINDSYAPQASAPLANQIAKRLMSSPALDLVSLEDAHAILEVEIINYEKDVYATRSDDTDLASLNKNTMQIKATLKDVKNGTTLFKDKIFTDSVDILTEGSALDNEYYNMPNLTERLAQKIVDSVLGIW